MLFFSGFGKKSIGWCLGLSGLAAVSVFGLSFWPADTALADDGDKPKASKEVYDLSKELAVVDFEKLLKDRPEYERIVQLDEQIQLLQRELEFLPLADKKRKVDSGRKRMEREVEKARKELEAEYGRVSGELNNFQASMKAQLEKEGKAISDHYQQVLQQRLAALQPKAPVVPQDLRQRLDSFVADLAVVREQRITAKRLELERSMQKNLEAEKARIDDAVADFDNSLMLANQDRRVELQLQLNTAATPEEESAIHDKLNAISEEESQAKIAKREELSASYEALVASEKQRISSELSSFEASLNAEAKAKADAEQKRLLSTVSVPSRESNRAEAEAQIARIKAAVDAEMEAKKAEMAASVQAKAAEAQKTMEKKQADIEKRLQALQRQLEDMVNKSNSEVSDDIRRKMDDTKAKIEELQKQRQEVYDGIVADLKKAVETVAAKQENPPSVIGSYVVNIDCTDLTDKTMIALEKN
ncbi:hypothetical protein IJT93_12760 [bacterium]|nr:hypothetical protein [bacterium]